MVSFATILAPLVVAAAFVNHADAHGFIATPASEFKSGASQSSWVAEFPPPWEGTFKTGAQWAAAAPGKGFNDLKSFLDDKGPTCGNTLADAKPKPIPADGKVKFSRPIVHAGPCEVWLDDKRAYQNDDCELEFGSNIPVFPVDFSSCSGGCMLRFYWLGLQDGGKRWQSYKNCVPLAGSGGASAGTPPAASTPATSAPDSSAKPTTAPDSNAKPTKTPKPSKTPKTPKPTKDDDKEGNDDDNAAPAPAVTPKKCNRRRLRN